MLKKYLILSGVLVFLIGACTREETVDTQWGLSGETIPVVLSVGIAEGQFDSQSAYEPMSRAGGEVLASIRNQYLCLIMKEIDGNWTVDTLLYPTIDANEGSWGNLAITGALPQNELRIDLTPGHYAMSVVLNYNSASSYYSKWERGTIVQASGNTPSPLVGYLVLGSSYGDATKAEKILYNEIFAGWTKFTVDKTNQLQPSGSPIPVTVATTRKVASLRIYLEESNASPTLSSTMNQYILFNMTAGEGYAFPDALDIWGDPYYSATPLTYMDGAFVVTQKYLPTDYGNFKIPAPPGDYQRWNGHYYFTDPAVTTGIPYTIADIRVSQSSQDNTIWFYEPTIDRKFYHNQQDGIAFKNIDGSETILIDNGNNGQSTEFHAKLVLSLDSQDQPLNAADLFTPHYDWNYK